MTYPEINSEDSFAKKEKYCNKKQKELRNKMKSLKHKEYQKLRVMVPSIASNPNVSKVTVIEEAVRYIDHLHTTLLTKLEEQDSKIFHNTEKTDKCVSGQGLLGSGSKALELVKKADINLYTKLCDQMQAFATKEFSSPRKQLYEDEFVVGEGMGNEPDVSTSE